MHAAAANFILTVEAMELLASLVDTPVPEGENLRAEHKREPMLLGFVTESQVEVTPFIKHAHYSCPSGGLKTRCAL